jgi:hypothetical protein
MRQFIQSNFFEGTSPMYNIAIIDDSPELLTELSNYFNG